MSYKHALALTAFGLGAVLQGCSEDDEKEPCTVNCEDKCKAITNYMLLTKDTTVDEDCVKCIGARPDVNALKDDTATTDILQWNKAIANSIKTDATAEQKAIPVAALQYCGAKQHEDACDGTSSVNYVTETDDIDAAVATVSAAFPNCGICHLLVASTDCATAKTGLEACGNDPEFNCALDYSCHDVATFSDIKDSAGAVVTGCKTCLDEEAAAATPSLTDYATAIAVDDAADQTSDAFEAISELWETCGANPSVLSCADIADLSANDVSFDLVMAKINAHGTDVASEAVAFNCGVCVASQAPSGSTCAELKAATEACGFTATLVCDACAAEKGYDAACVACADAVAGSSIEDLAAHDSDSSDPSDSTWSSKIVSAMTQCGAESFAGVVHSTSCAGQNLGVIDLSGFSDAASIGGAVDGFDLPCDMCVSYHVASVSDGDRTDCGKWEAAVTACASTAPDTNGCN